MTRAAIGFRPHTGWTAALVLAGSAGALRVVERARLELVEGGDRFCFHRARDLVEGGAPLSAARKVAGDVERRAARAAEQALSGLVASLSERGLRLAGVGVPRAAKPLPDFEAVVASHSLVHAAEGELYRQVLADAAGALKLKVVRPPSNAKALYAHAATALQLKPAELEQRLEALGREAGRPWAVDQRESALAAWLALG